MIAAIGGHAVRMLNPNAGAVRAVEDPPDIRPHPVLGVGVDLRLCGPHHLPITDAVCLFAGITPCRRCRSR